MMNRSTYTLLALAFLATACTTRRASVEPQPTTTKRPADSGDGAGRSSDRPETPSDGSQGASLPVNLDEKAIQQFVDDTTKLSYKFSYATKQSEGDIQFTAGKAKLTLADLPTGVESDLTLDIYEGAVLRLKGEIKKLTLTANMPAVDLALQAVGGGNVADLTLEVVIGSTGGSGGGTQPPGNGGGGNNPPPSGGNNPPPSGGNNPPPSGGGGTGNGPSFAREVKPLLDRYCAECHHGGARAPDLSAFPFKGATSASEQAAVVAKILASIDAGRMPPAPRDRMTQAEVDAIRAWDRGGLTP